MQRSPGTTLAHWIRRQESNTLREHLRCWATSERCSETVRISFDMAQEETHRDAQEAPQYDHGGQLAQLRCDGSDGLLGGSGADGGNGVQEGSRKPQEAL